MTHRISRLPFLGDETLVALPGIRGFDAVIVFAQCMLGNGRFPLVALEPEFEELLLDTPTIRRDVDPTNVIVAHVTGAMPKGSRCESGINLAQVAELMARQPIAHPTGLLHSNMWGTGCVVKERPDRAVIIRWWDPGNVEFTQAFGEAGHGDVPGYVLGAVPSSDIAKWAIQGMRVVFPF